MTLVKTFSASGGSDRQAAFEILVQRSFSSKVVNDVKLYTGSKIDHVSDILFGFKFFETSPCLYPASSAYYNNTIVCEGGNVMDQDKIALFDKNIEKLDEMQRLGDDWDGEGAAAFSDILIGNIKDLLWSLASLQPNLFPKTDSRIQLEFYDQNNYLELIISNSECEVYITDGENLSNDVFDEFEYSREKIVSLVQKFYDRKST